MEQIIITKKDGTRAPIVTRGDVTAITQATQKWNINGDDTISLSVTSVNARAFDVGDRIRVFGRTYRLNRLPKVQKVEAHQLQYTLEFEGVQYDLMAATFDVNVDTTNNELQDVQGESLTGDLARFMSVLVANANRVFGAGVWNVGRVIATDGDITMSFAETDNCLSVLQSLCSKFNCEFEIEENNGVFIINMVEATGRTLPYTFQYGRGRGLYDLMRQNVSSSNIVTRLKVFGSNENITSKYRADRLCLPGCSKSRSYIENATIVAKYGVYEAKKYFDVKPSFSGSVGALVVGDVVSFVDTTIDFDLNAKNADGEHLYLLDGQAARVHFNTGNLAGYEFDVGAYDHATHKITLVRTTDDRGMTFPSDTSEAFRFAVGDEYKLLGITLPDAYVAAAEAELQTQATEYYNQNAQPKVKYSLSFDKVYLEREFGADCGTTNVFMPGDTIHIIDADIAVDKDIRVVGIERNILDEYDYTLTIADEVTTSVTTRVISDLVEIQKIIQTNKLGDVARARRNWQTSRELLEMVFDADGDYYSEKIKPLSIETSMLAVGAKSQQFTINTTFFPNATANAANFAWNSGVIAHFTIEENVRQWAFPGGLVSNLTNTPLYLYCRAEKSTTTAAIVLSATQYKVDNGDQYYYFLLGVLSSETDWGNGKRSRTLSLTYGATTITGRQVQTGRISATNGNTYFDLDDSVISGNISFIGNDSVVRRMADVNDNVQANKTYIETTLPPVLSGLQSQVDNKIETHYSTTDPSSAWPYTPDKMKHIGDIWYDTQNNNAYRYNASLSWDLITDSKAVAALAAANTAQATANSKRRVFTGNASVLPTPPYDVGDLWVQGESGIILYCKTAKTASQQYAASDWVSAGGYATNAEISEFISALEVVIDDIYDQLDGVIETWFYSGVPTLSNAPAVNWSDAQTRRSHLGDLYFDNDSGVGYRFSLDGSTFKWVEISDSGIATALAAAARAQDTADSKRRVFVNTPYAPYDTGDLWLNDGRLYRCVTPKLDGQQYAFSDWTEAVSYTAISDFTYFVGVISDAYNEMAEQIDGKVECFYTNTDPSSNWQQTDYESHLGDLWFNTSANTLKRFALSGATYLWIAIEDQRAIDAASAAAAAQDTADGKRRIFVATPTTPYDVGDMWAEGANGDIFVCTTARASGGYRSTDWSRASKYTDDTALNNFVNVTYANNIADLRSQIDGKIESWFTTTDPAASWLTDADKAKHVGDLWFKTNNGETESLLYRYVNNGNTYQWARVYDKDVIDAANAAAAAQDTADGKRRVFVSTQQHPTPTPPYDEGDLWFDGTDVKTCVSPRTGAQSYSPNDWDVKVGYDNTKTAIDGGLVTSGTIQVAGDNTNILAGITGNGTGNSAVRFWAGASHENRATAPFRVTQDGSLKSTKADIEGKITAKSGVVGGFTIEENTLSSSATDASGAKIKLNGNNGEARIGKMSVAANGNVTIKNLTAAGGTFSGLINATGGIKTKGSYSESHNDYTTSASDSLHINGSDTNTGDSNVYLPSTPNTGQMLFLKWSNAGTGTHPISIHAQGNHFILGTEWGKRQQLREKVTIWDGGSEREVWRPARFPGVLLVFDGTNWVVVSSTCSLFAW